MDIDKEKQARALAKARQSLLQAEIKRSETRLNKNLGLFFDEKFDILLNDEFVEKLADHITKQYHGNQRKAAIEFLDKLEISICSNSAPIRERSLIVLMLVSEHVYRNNIRELSVIIARIAANWLYFENEFIAGFEPVCRQLQRIVVEMLLAQQWYEAEQLIVTLNKISNKTLSKNNLIYGVTSRVHDQLAEPEVLDTLIDTYLGESSQRTDIVETILLNMGQQGSQYLIQRLTHSNDKDERLALLNLIPRIGEISQRTLAHYLEDGQPWYVTRNIIMIISRLLNDDLYEDVKPHLAHEDIRVQQQVVNCIEVLGGEQTEKRLLEALFTINDDLKIHLIDQLIQYNSPRVETALLDLLDLRDRFSSHVSDFLIMKLCSKLAVFPSEKSISCLLVLIDERKERFGDHDTIVKAASDALIAIEQAKSDDPDFSERVPDSPENESIMEEVLAQLPADLADISGTYGDNGLSDVFVESLTDTLTAKQPAPDEWSPEPMFLSHHSQAHHLMVWSSFYEQLDTKEANRFFSTLIPETFQPGDTILEQGADNADLYFIDQGYAEVNHTSESGNIMFTPLLAGEVIGGVVSFKDQPWPVSVQAQTELQVRRLNQAGRDALQKELPELMAKLEHYCRRYDVIPQLVSKAIIENPDQTGPVIVVRGTSIFQTDDGGQTDSELIGTIPHVLSGGFSLQLPVSGDANAALCLGHQVTAELNRKDGARQTRFGIISGSGSHERSDNQLQIYVKLYHPSADDHYTCKSIVII